MNDFRFLAYAFFLAFTLVWIARSRRFSRLWRVLGVVGLFVIAATTVQFREGRVDWFVWGIAGACAVVSVALARLPFRRT
jgi:hypothetical protein